MLMTLESAPKSSKNKAAAQETHSERKHNARERRLEMALRANLKRRKTQTRSATQRKTQDKSS